LLLFYVRSPNNTKKNLVIQRTTSTVKHNVVFYFVYRSVLTVFIREIHKVRFKKPSRKGDVVFFSHKTTTRKPRTGELSKYVQQQTFHCDYQAVLEQRGQLLLLPFTGK